MRDVGQVINASQAVWQPHLAMQNFFVMSDQNIIRHCCQINRFQFETLLKKDSWRRAVPLLQHPDKRYLRSEGQALVEPAKVDEEQI